MHHHLWISILHIVGRSLAIDTTWLAKSLVTSPVFDPCGGLSPCVYVSVWLLLLWSFSPDLECMVLSGVKTGH